MCIFLRRFLGRHLQGGILSSGAFYCNDNSLSFYAKVDEIVSKDGIGKMKAHFERKDEKKYGIYELSKESLRDFGLCPVEEPDMDDAAYGKYHFESICFEKLYTEDAGPQMNIATQLMNRRKSKLALLAQSSIIFMPDD